MVATSSSSSSKGGGVSMNSNAGNPLANGGFFKPDQLHLKKRGFYNENVFKKAKQAKVRRRSLNQNYDNIRSG